MKDMFLHRALSRLDTAGSPPVQEISMSSRKLSPLNNSDLQMAFLRLASELYTDSRANDDKTKAKAARLSQAVSYAINQPNAAPINDAKAEPTTGLDEVLQGRAGLLWAMLIIRSIAVERDRTAVVESLTRHIRPLIDRIIASGTQKSNDGALPNGLVWTWINNFYGLGAMHGSTGILSVLLSCDDEEIEQSFTSIAKSIDHLCSVCIAEGGHLPMSTPPFPSKAARSSPLLQLCHGSPGLLLLLAYARRNETFTLKHWKVDWDKALDLASLRIWEQGLLSKGLGVCHGIAGNALPWVLLATTKGSDDRDALSRRQGHWLSLAIPFLMEAKDAQPLGHDERFRTPDSPFSLLEGLAGTIVVLNEATKAIRTFLDTRAVGM